MAANLQNIFDIPEERDVSFPPAHIGSFDIYQINLLKIK